MIIIAGTIDFVDRAARDDAAASSVAFQEASRTGEPGCLAYCFAPDPVVADRIQVFELWADEVSLAAHFQHPNYFNMRDLLGSLGIRATDNKKYRVDLSEPVYDDTRTPRADFFTAT